MTNFLGFRLLTVFARSRQLYSATDDSTTELPTPQIEDDVLVVNELQPQAIVSPDQVIPGEFSNSAVYPDPGLGTILSREYLIDSFLWASTDTSGKVIAQYSFPHALFNQPNLVDKLSKFDFFRAGVEVIFRINGTGFHFGRLMVSALPSYDATDYAAGADPLHKFGNIYSSSQNLTAVISAKDNAPTIIKIPFKRDEVYLNLATYDHDAPLTHNIANVYVFVEHPLMLGNDGSTPSLQIAVFARFINPEVAGASTVVRELTPTQPATINLAAGWHEQGGNEKRVEIKEQVVRSKSGLISSKLEGAGRFIGRLVKVPLIGEYASIAKPMVLAASKLFKAAGLDKPTTLVAPQATYTQFGLAMANGKGIDVSQKLAIDPENSVGCDHSLIGLGGNETSLSYIMSRPYLGFISFFSSTQTADTVLAKIPVTPLYSHSAVTTSEDYYTKVKTSLQAWYASMFDYWRGSMSYTFSFSASLFTTARVRITWLPTVYEWKDFTTMDAADSVTRIVDIKGDTEVSFDVPYLANRLWKRGGAIVGSYDGLSEPEVDEMCNGIIIVSVVNPAIAASPGYDSTIYYSVRMAAAGDLQLAKYRGLPSGISYEPSTALVAQPSYTWFEQAGLVPTSGTTMDSGILMGENVADIRSLLHRYHYAAEYTGVSNATSFGGYRILISGRMPKYLWQSSPLLLPYLWYRGSIRMKFIWTAGAKPVYVTLRPKKPVNSADPGSALVSIHSSPNPNYYAVGQGGSTYLCGSLYPECTVEIPYFSDKLAIKTISHTHTANVSSATYDPDCDMRLDSAATFTVQAFSAMGDDFDAGMLSSAPSVLKFNLNRLGL